MILIPRTVFIICLILLVAGIVALGFFGYKANPDSAGEWNLYWHICSAALAALIFGFMIFRSMRLTRYMDNLITMSKHRGFSPEASMRKLGKIGEKITLLYFELQSLSDKKSLKIAAQRDLIDFLSGIVREKLIITDVTGTVLYISRSFTESIPGGKAEHIGKDLDTLIPGIAFERVVGELTRKHIFKEVEVDNKTLSFHPVFNRRADLGYIVVSMEKLHFTPVTITAKAQSASKGSMQDRLRKILGRS